MAKNSANPIRDQNDISVRVEIMAAAHFAKGIVDSNSETSILLMDWSPCRKRYGLSFYLLRKEGDSVGPVSLSPFTLYDKLKENYEGVMRYDN